MTRPEQARFRKINRTLGPGNYHRISRATGVTPQHVSRFLRGMRGATFDTAVAIADSAEVGLDDVRFYINKLVEVEVADVAA